MAPLKVHGAVRVPGDKSISHRALILGALATGESRIEGVLASADVASTAGVLRSLGAAVPELRKDLRIVGRGLRSLSPSRGALDCGNSGTTARLLAGVLAGHPFTSRLVGDSSLSRRPMRRVARPLTAMGATISLAPGDTLPMEIRGAGLSPVTWTTEVPSAQVKSAILLAGLVAGVRVAVREGTLSRDHTERMLAARGAPVTTEDGQVSLDPVPSLEPAEAPVPADPSSAAFFAALAALSDAGELALPDVCLNPTRIGFFRALARMGARIEMTDVRESGGEPVGTVVVSPGPLRGTRVGADEVPSLIDELPLLACVATRAEGETVVTGAAELRVKESDRIAAVVSNLRALGADAEELPDGLRVTGARTALRGAVRTHGDHRIAMAFGVLGALAGNDVRVDDPDCASVSYPAFWRDLRAVSAG